MTDDHIDLFFEQSRNTSSDGMARARGAALVRLNGSSKDGGMAIAWGGSSSATATAVLSENFVSMTNDTRR